MIVIIDYGMGNIASVKNALDFLKLDSRISSAREDLEKATHLILPGVGAFAEGMRRLKDYNLVDVLKEEVVSGKKPFLGICLGMQLMAERGQEGGEHSGLGWIQGVVKRLQVDEKQYRIPHIGWNDVLPENNMRLFMNTEPNTFYFVHSFHLELGERGVRVATTEYGEKFTASIEKENLFGVQFHPERSQKSGLRVLENFSHMHV